MDSNSEGGPQGNLMFVYSSWFKAEERGTGAPTDSK